MQIPADAATLCKHSGHAVRRDTERARQQRRISYPFAWQIRLSWWISDIVLMSCRKGSVDGFEIRYDLDSHDIVLISLQCVISKPHGRSQDRFRVDKRATHYHINDAERCRNHMAQEKMRTVLRLALAGHVFPPLQRLALSGARCESL